MRSVYRVIFFCLFLMTYTSSVAYAATEDITLDWETDLCLSDADAGLKGTDFSISQYVSDVLSGDSNFSFRYIVDSIKDQVIDRWEYVRQSILQILALAVFAGVFVRFSGTLGDSDIGEMGFYVVYLILIGIVSGAFFEAYEIASVALGDLVDFMKVLVPSFSLALCYGGGTQSSIVFYEAMLMAIGCMEMLMSYILLPGVQIYFFLSMIDLMAEGRFSRMVELIGSALRMCTRVLFGILIGYQGIQGMLVPVMDRVKANTLLQSAKGLPGVGNTVGSVLDTLFSSGVLIKSAVGVGGLIAILLLCVYPIIQLALFALSYKISGALVQPVSDTRIVTMLVAVHNSGKLLLGYVSAAALMFMLSIVIVLVSTNMIGG